MSAPIDLSNPTIKSLSDAINLACRREYTDRLDHTHQHSVEAMVLFIGDPQYKSKRIHQLMPAERDLYMIALDAASKWLESSSLGVSHKARIRPRILALRIYVEVIDSHRRHGAILPEATRQRIIMIIWFIVKGDDGNLVMRMDQHQIQIASNVISVARRLPGFTPTKAGASRIAQLQGKLKQVTPQNRRVIR